jgi:hypothetical protein
MALMKEPPKVGRKMQYYHLHTLVNEVLIMCTNTVPALQYSFRCFNRIEKYPGLNMHDMAATHTTR